MSADAVVPSSTAATSTAATTTAARLPRQRTGGSVVEHHSAGQLRQLRRRAMCRLGVHTSVFTWAPGRGVWCNHCHTRVADA